MKQTIKAVIWGFNSEWEAHIFFETKMGWRLRFCVDYRRLNTMSVKDSYQFPRMQKCIYTLGNARTFITLDTFNGYFQI